jgi:protein involved in polysaccharide export with SLBB domain
MAVLIAGAVQPASISAAQQEPWQIPGVGATRDTLEQLAAFYESGARSQAYSPELRTRARDEAAALRTRLQDGDFRVGDRVVMVVEAELALTDTFIVTSGPSIELPVVGVISLRGVLRSELQQYLQQQVGRYIAQPDVRARTYVRLAFAGEIQQPGYHMLPIETPLPDAIMAVGGPTTFANLKGIKVVRGDGTVLKGRELYVAMSMGETLDALQLREGDTVNVPRRPVFTFGQIVGYTAAIVSTFVVVERLLSGRR